MPTLQEKAALAYIERERDLINAENELRRKIGQRMHTLVKDILGVSITEIRFLNNHPYVVVDGYIFVPFHVLDRSTGGLMRCADSFNLGVVGSEEAILWDSLLPYPVTELADLHAWSEGRSKLAKERSETRAQRWWRFWA